MTVELDLTADEQVLQDAVRRALQDASPIPALTASAADPAAIARRHWALAAEMGWPGLLIPEAAGGAGMAGRELAILCEEMGRHLFSAPFLATAVIGATIAAFAQQHGKMNGIAAEIAGGGMVLAAAAVPPHGVWPADRPSLTIGPDGEISGAREVVEHPDLATHFLVVDACERTGGSLDLIAALLPAGGNVRIERRQGLDVSCPIASLQFDKQSVMPDGLLRVSLSRDEFSTLFRPLHVAIAAELTGVAQAALDGAVGYAKTREQFGKPIGSFQAIKHKLADAFVLTTNARLAVRFAAGGTDVSAAEAARVLAADAALKATADYIQVQGGMGISWESEAHLYLKRARRLVAAYGDTQRFRRAIADRFIASVLGDSKAGGTTGS